MITLALKLLKVHAYFSFGLFICEQTFEFIKLEWNAQSHNIHHHNLLQKCSIWKREMWGAYHEEAEHFNILF